MNRSHQPNGPALSFTARSVSSRDSKIARTRPQIEGVLRSRKYQKDGSKHRVWECLAESILKLDRATKGSRN